MGALAQELFKISSKIITPLNKSASKVWPSRVGFVVENVLEGKAVCIFFVATNWGDIYFTYLFLVFTQICLWFLLRKSEN